jgi:hypothetical protein
MSDIPVVKHYRQGKIQAIDVIADWELNFSLGNVLKYVGRAGKKESATQQEDLQKALWYLVFEVTQSTGVADNIVTAVSSISETRNQSN